MDPPGASLCRRMVLGVALERITLKLPPDFDQERHAAKLPALLEAKEKGKGWVVESIDPEKGTATMVRQSSVMTVRETTGEEGRAPAFEIRLPVGTKPADGDRVAARQADAHPGYHLVKFEPHIGKAVLARLTDDELRCRGAIANALGVKPWEVQVQARPDGGFAAQLPGAYAPSKHDTKLQEVAESIVGRFGWFITVDPRTLVAQILPSEPPTFPAVIPFPFDTIRPVSDFGRAGDRERFSLVLAEGLGAPGERNAPISMDLDDSTALLLVGLPGSGKSKAMQALVAQALVQGFRLAIINASDKKTDYAWAKPYVEANWWGCDDSGDSVAEALTVASLVDEEGKRMGALLVEHGVGKWQELPEAVKAANRPVLVVADELARLLSKPNLPAGLTKEAKSLPQFVEMAQNFLEAKLLTLKLAGLVAVHRAAGIREFYLSQRPSKTDGFPPELKTIIPHRVLLGPSPSEADLALAFRDPRRVRRVPVNVSNDPEASRGAGIAHLDGTEPVVIKGFFGTNEDYEQFLRRHLGPGDPSDDRVRPTDEQIARLVPRADGESLDEDEVEPITLGGELTPSGKPVSSLDPKFGPGPAAYGSDGKRLKGAAAAAHASAGSGNGPPCPSCDKPIQADGSCGCSW